MNMAKRTMTELHCHILPGIDDGAKDLECSLALLREEKKQGVESIVFTPHFNIDKISVEDFVAARNNAYQKLAENEEFQAMNFSTKLASEVYFSVSLDKAKLDDLCFGDTDYILVEFPFHFKPHGMMYMIDNVINRGYTPIIAHVERYDYVSKDPTILYDLVERGCLAHVNAEVLIKNSSKSSLPMKYIKWGLVHFICTDCHSIEKRPPNIEQGYSIVKNKLGEKYYETLTENAKRVFNGKRIDLSEIKRPRNFLGTWI